MPLSRHREIVVRPGMKLEALLDAPDAADGPLFAGAAAPPPPELPPAPPATCDVLGIDPGVDGGLVLLPRQGRPRCAVMPSELTGKGKRRQVDRRALAQLLRELAPDRVYLEQVGPHSSDGVLQAFSFGRNVESVESALVHLGLRYETVPPQTWQAAMFVGLPKDNTKATAKRVCSRLWPTLWPTGFYGTPRCKTPHEGICDAALIAEWGRRQR